MNADIEGCLENLNRSYKVFEHNGQSMTKKQVKAILEYGLKMGYEATNEFTDKEIDKILKREKDWESLENSNLDQKLIKW